MVLSVVGSVKTPVFMFRVPIQHRCVPDVGTTQVYSISQFASEESYAA